MLMEAVLMTVLEMEGAWQMVNVDAIHSLVALTVVPKTLAQPHCHKTFVIRFVLIAQVPYVIQAHLLLLPLHQLIMPLI